jgi:hypothetical protein
MKNALINCTTIGKDCFDSDLRLPYSGFSERAMIYNAGKDLPEGIINVPSGLEKVGVPCE